MEAIPKELLVQMIFKVYGYQLTSAKINKAILTENKRKAVNENETNANDIHNKRMASPNIRNKTALEGIEDIN